MKRQGLTVDEYQQIAGVSRNTAYAAVRAGDVPSIRVGSRIVIPRHAVEAMFGPVVLDDDPETVEGHPLLDGPPLRLANLHQEGR